MHGKNIYKVRVPMKNFRRWDLDTPYLYSAQVTLFENGKPTDAIKSQFGRRTFTENMDEDENGLRGMFFLNGRSIRLRGANTMGYEQNDVLRGDTEQLIDDILLAKLCNMNFLRLTQRPVQDEVYTYCDRLGLMTQTDLPLFAKMRRTKFAEGVKQAGGNGASDSIPRMQCYSVVYERAVSERRKRASPSSHTHRNGGLLQGM